MSQSSHLPDQPIMKYVHPTDRLRPWFGVAVGLAALAGMLAFGILGRNFGTSEHLKALNDAGGWLAMSLIEASAGILALLLAAVALGERIERGVDGSHFISLIRLTARGGFATIAPAVSFEVLKIASSSVIREGWVVGALAVVQMALLAATTGAFTFNLLCAADEGGEMHLWTEPVPELPEGIQKALDEDYILDYHYLE